jgi:hypothetical protein
MRNRFENMMASVLTPEQMEKFRAMRTQRGGQAQSRRGTLWTLEGGAQAHGCASAWPMTAIPRSWKAT